MEQCERRLASAARAGDCRREDCLAQPSHAALSRKVYLADALDLVAEEFDAVGVLRPGREDVHESAAPRDAARVVGQHRHFVAQLFERTKQAGRVEVLAGDQRQSRLLKLRARAMLRDRCPRGHDQRAPTATQQRERPRPFDRHRRFVAQKLVRQALAFGQPCQWDVFNEESDFLVQPLRAGRAGRQQERRPLVAGGERGGHRGLRRLRHAEARFTLPREGQRADHFGDCGCQADKFTRHPNFQRPAPRKRAG